MVTEPYEIGPGIRVVAGPEMTDGRDALAYLVEDGGRWALIDAGAGPSVSRIAAHLRAAGCGPDRLDYIVATHAHIDHIGGLAVLARDFSPLIVAHELDADAIESADPVRTAASWYGLRIEPVEVQRRIQGRKAVLPLGRGELFCLHTPGHTPGSMVVYLDRDGRRYLFGQDIHGPFDASFGSDKALWRESMETLLGLGADVLAEGHYGIYEGRDEVERFIRSFLNP